MLHYFNQIVANVICLLFGAGCYLIEVRERWCSWLKETNVGCWKKLGCKPVSCVKVRHFVNPSIINNLLYKTFCDIVGACFIVLIKVFFLNCVHCILLLRVPYLYCQCGDVMCVCFDVLINCWMGQR